MADDAELERRLACIERLLDVESPSPQGDREQRLERIEQALGQLFADVVIDELKREG